MISKARLILFAFTGAVAAACGAAEAPVNARIQVEEPREARVALSPALDVRSILDPALADRIVIDSIQVNLSDARLLGTDPSIPTAGLRLIDHDRVLENIGDGTPGAEFPFPENLLDDTLAIYLRLGSTAELQGASVVVRARLFELPVETATHPLREQAPDPDGDPAMDGDKAPDPDGDPAMGGGDEAPDPDGDPAMKEDPKRCAPDPDGDPAMKERCRITRRSLERQVPSIPFELRGSDEVDLVVGFDDDSHLNVVLGIPAGRWFTTEVIQQLEKALDVASDAPVDAEGVTSSERKTVIVASSSGSKMSDVKQEGEEDDYSLLDENEIDPRNIRSR
jgi:hypothetical protein